MRLSMFYVYVKMASLVGRLQAIRLLQVTSLRHWPQTYWQYHCLQQQRWASTDTKQATEESPKTPKERITLSDGFVKKLKEMNEPDSYVRLVVEGGGCSGFQYKFDLGMDSDIGDEDMVFERDGARLVIDKDSLEFVKGSVVDYHQELIRSAFQVQNNPKAEQGCSCGASFALKL